MKTRIVSFLFIAVVASLQTIHALETRSFTVVDANGTPVAGATVALLSLPDSTVVAATITDADGNALLTNASNAKMVSVRCIGFRTFRSQDVDNKHISLAEASKELGDVVVTGKKPSLKSEAGKFIFSPANLAREVPNSVELLKCVPLLSVNEQEVTILGKGPSTIYINGRAPNMDNQALFAMLKSTPPENIKKIEIITLPGSTHSASMAGGIVNIVIDDPYRGWRGAITTTTQYFYQRISPNAGIWLGYSGEKLKASAGAYYTGVNSHSVVESTYDYNLLDKHILNMSRQSGWANHISGYLNLSYDFSSKSSAGISFRAAGSKSSDNTRTFTRTMLEGDDFSSTSDITTTTPWKRPMIGVTAYYKLTTDNKGSNIDLTADYGSRLSESTTDYLFDSDEARQNTSVDSYGAHVKSQYHFVLNDNQKFDIGYDITKSRTDNDFDFYEQSNRFIYKEMVNSGFIQWNARWSPAFSTNAGLRMENSAIKGVQTEGNESFKRNYTDWFPSAGLSLDLPKNQNISINFSRRIFRPFYSDLNPFKTWTSDNTYTTGNPYLKPSYNTNITLYYSFLENFTAHANYMLCTNMNYDYIYNLNGYTVTGTANGGREKNAALALEYRKNLFEFWRIKATVNVTYENDKAFLNNENISYRAWRYSFRINNDIIISKKDGLWGSIYYNFSSPTKMLTRKGKYKNLLYITLYKMFNSQWTISASANDLLNYKNDYHCYSPDYSYENHSRLNGSYVSLSIYYSFGKKNVSGAENKSQTVLDSKFSN